MTIGEKVPFIWGLLLEGMACNPYQIGRGKKQDDIEGRRKAGSKKWE